MRTPHFAALLAVIVLAVYGPGIAAPLSFDDHDALGANPSIRSLATALSPPPQTPVAGRPLVNLSFALSYAVTGLSPSGFRAVSFVLHLLNALLAFWLASALLARPAVPVTLRQRSRGVAQAIALLWLVHPLGSEAVMYVTQRTEQLAATFYLLTLVAAVRALDSSERGERARLFALLAGAACLLGTQCKETIVSAPLAVLLIDRALYAQDLRALWKERRGLYLGLLLSWLALALVLASSPRGQTAGLGLGVGPLTALATQGSVITHYLRLAALPYPLSISYDWPLAEPLLRYWLADLFVVGLFAGGLWLLSRRRWLAALPWLVFFGVLAPSSSVVPVLGELAAERRMYLPLLALIAFVVCVGAWRARDLQLRVLQALVGLLALGYAVTSSARVHDYRSERALFEHTLRYQPENPIAIWGLGDALAKQGERKAALALYERMARGHRPYRGPFSWGTRGLLAAAQLHARAGDQRLAQRTMRRAFLHDPDSAVGMLYRAAQLRRAGQREQALALSAQVLEGPHLRAEAHVLAGYLCRELGDDACAQQHFLAATQLDSTGAALALVRQLSALPPAP